MDVASKALSCPSHSLHHFNVFLQRIKISFGLSAQHVPAVTPVNVWALFSRFSGNMDMGAIVNVVDIVIGVSIVNGMGMLDIMDIFDNVVRLRIQLQGPLFTQVLSFCVANLNCIAIFAALVRLQIFLAQKQFCQSSLSMTECGESNKDGKVN